MQVAEVAIIARRGGMHRAACSALLLRTVIGYGVFLISFCLGTWLPVLPFGLKREG